MILIIPIVIGAAAGLTAIFGVGAGLDGLSKQDEANEIGKSAQKRYESKQKSVATASEATNEIATEYGQLQIEVKRETIGRFATYIEKIGRQASQSDLKFLEGLEISHQQLQEYKATSLEAENFAKGSLKAASAGAAAGQGAVTLVGLFGTASTGTAISGLSGAAAWNATLAWLGGGSLAAGGGGMALGTIMLGGIAVGPALMIGGFVIGGQGEKALTEARNYEATVNTKIAKLDAFEEFLGQVQGQIEEQKELIESLNKRAIDCLIKLESRPLPFDRERDEANFYQVGVLVKALAEIIKTPILNAEGNLNSDVAEVKAKYRSL